MKILVYPHDLSIGGSQLNAVEIAARVRDKGNEVVIFGQPGPLNVRIDELGLEFIASSPPRRRPSRAVVHDLAHVVETRRFDVVHGYEWPPALESYLGCRGIPSTLAVATVMSMAVAPFIPHSMPLIVGTHQIAESERRAGRELVSTLEPPVDLAANSPVVTEGVKEFRSHWNLASTDLTVVTVTRLAHEMKLEGLIAAIEAFEQLTRQEDVRLVIVGDGPARRDVQACADATNRRARRDAIILTGELTDPRPAYAASDIVFGMGGSALRALAFGKPLIVQGECGFWRLLTSDSVNDFLWNGWYGVGESKSAGKRRFISEIAPLLNNGELRSSLGDFGRSLVQERFSLDRAGERQIEIYAEEMVRTVSSKQRLADLGRSAMLFGKYAAGRQAGRLLGRAPKDDFNSRPVLLNGPSRPIAQA